MSFPKFMKDAAARIVRARGATLYVYEKCEEVMMNPRKFRAMVPSTAPLSQWPVAGMFCGPGVVATHGFDAYDVSDVWFDLSDETACSMWQGAVYAWEAMGKPAG